MNTSNNYNKNKWLSFVMALFVGAVTLLGLQACGGGGGSSKVVNADPAGYYTGTAAVKDASGGDLTVSDMQGMINGTRFMVFSNTLKLLYDGTITNITENAFTANVTIYKTTNQDTVLVNTTTIKGTITEGSQITGTIEGTAAFNGNFTLVFALSNGTASDVSTLLTLANEVWSGRVTESGGISTHQITFPTDGTIIDLGLIASGTFGGCITTSGALVPVANSPLFTVTQSFDGCDDITINGKEFTGLATTVNGQLIMAFSDGVLAISTNYDKISF